MNHYMNFEYSYIDSKLLFREGICIDKYCDSETSVIVPTQIDNLPVIYIGNLAFSRCWNLTSIKIPDSVTFIGESAFSGCTGLGAVSSMNGMFLLDSADETGDDYEI